jgi:hypothetical protein
MLWGILAGGCQPDPIGETLKTFFEDFIRQVIAAAVT